MACSAGTRTSPPGPVVASTCTATTTPTPYATRPANPVHARTVTPTTATVTIASATPHHDTWTDPTAPEPRWTTVPSTPTTSPRTRAPAHRRTRRDPRGRTGSGYRR